MGSPKKALLAGRSPLRAATLAAVLEGPAHGYEIASRVKLRVGPSWRIHAKHLYSVLDALEEDGLVRSEDMSDEGPRKPGQRRLKDRDRTVYFPTPEAARARTEWMGAPASLSLVRADIEARLVFSRSEEAPILLEVLDRYEQDIIAALEANAAVDTPRVSWLGMMLSAARASVSKRLDAERAWISSTRRDIEEFIAETQ